MDEREDNCEELILLASTIAVELSKGKDIRELKRIRSLINQISCTLTTIITEKFENIKKN